MGKSIYERADDAMRYRSRIYEEPASYDFKSGYEKGATEQEEITKNEMIEKACQSFCVTQCPNGCPLQKDFVCGKFMNFRKMMRE